MCIWGASWSSAKVLSDYSSASTITFVRFLIVPLVLFPFLKWKGISLGLNKSGWIWVVAAGVLMGVYTLLFFSGLQEGMPGAGGVLVTISIPIIASVIGLFLDRRVPKKAEQAGLFLGIIAGVFLIRIWDSFDGLFSGGNLFFMIAATVYAALSKVTSRSSKFGHPIAFNAWLHTIAIVGLSFTTDFSEVRTLFLDADRRFLYNILYFGIINSSFATTTYFYSTTKIGSEKASTFLFIVPSTAVLFSWLILGEAIMISTAIGGILGILAVFIINGKISLKSN